MLLGGAGAQIRNIRNVLLGGTSWLKTVFLIPATADSGFGEHVHSHLQ